MNEKNIIWFNTGVSKGEREKRNGHKAVLLWLTGLPASGKSTLAKELHVALFQKGLQVFVLDGDNVRHGLNGDLGFSTEDRQENIRRIGEVSKLFIDAGLIVIAAFISPLQQDRNRVRSLFADGDFVEVYMKCDASTCEKRDKKGNYQKAKQGIIKEFTGVSAPYEPPQSPELTLDSTSKSIQENLEQVLQYLFKRKVFEETS